MNKLRGKYLKNIIFTNHRKLLSQFLILNLLISLIGLTILLGNYSPTLASRTDEQEPNDSFNDAMEISTGTYSGNVDQTDHVDFFAVNLSGGKSLSLEFRTNETGNRTALVFYNNLKEEIWNTSWVEHNSITFFNYTTSRATTKAYYLGVWAESTGNMYDLIVSIKAQNDGNSGGDASGDASEAFQIVAGKYTGLLANEDTSDFYYFTLPTSSCAIMNVSVPDGVDDDVKFNFFTNETTLIRSIPDISPGTHRILRYTNNGSTSLTPYLQTTITDGRSEYSIKLDIQFRHDATANKDAGDNINDATELPTPDISFKGWLGAGNTGNDASDFYYITILEGNKTTNVSLNIIPNSSLDIVVNMYNDSLALVKSLNPSKGGHATINYSTNYPQHLYIELKVDPGVNSDGEYSIKYSIITSGLDLDNDRLPDDWEIDHFGSIDTYNELDDPDLDKLNNLKEYNKQTDPNDPDSDDDRMTDGWEADMGLDPLKDDSAEDPDSDQYTNLQEFYNLTDPLDASSSPHESYPHLTPEATKRAYTDGKADVRYIQGYNTNNSEKDTILENKIGDYKDYDILSLNSNRVGNELVVKMTVSGIIDDVGDLESENTEKQPTELTYYWVGFVNESFVEPKYSEEEKFEPVTFWDPRISHALVYINHTFMGTTTTTGNKVDNNQALEWRVPLAEIADLDVNFELYGLVNHIYLTYEGNKDNFEIHFDSIGKGSINPSGSQTDITVMVKKTVMIDEHEIEVSIGADGHGGVINVKKVEKPDVATPKGAGDLGFYIDIELTGGVKAKNIFFSLEYNESEIPEGFSEKDIKLYYFDTGRNAWVRVKNSGVWTNNNTAWARPEHLTIFAPMSKPGEEESESSDMFWYLIIIITIIVIVIIIVVAVAVIRSKKRRRRMPPARPGGPRRALTPEFFPCPRCDEEIEILYSEAPKVALECPSCGAKGKIANPYLRQRGRVSRDDYYDRDYEREPRGREPPRGRGPERDIEYKPPSSARKRVTPPRIVSKDEDDYEYIKCPKCHSRIPIPYEEDEKIAIRCSKCGAKGKVSNPYLK